VTETKIRRREGPFPALGGHELDHLDLVELVAPDGAALLGPVASRLPPVAGGVGERLERELVAEALLAYKRIGVTQFILSGFPDIEEVERFGREVVPLVREAEGPS